MADPVPLRPEAPQGQASSRRRRRRTEEERDPYVDRASFEMIDLAPQAAIKQASGGASPRAGALAYADWWLRSRRPQGLLVADLDRVARGAGGRPCRAAVAWRPRQGLSGAGRGARVVRASAVRARLQERAAPWPGREGRA
jgi:hypothetical protein